MSSVACEPSALPLSAACRCPACGAGDIAPGMTVPDREYVLPYLARYAECRSCASLFQDPMPGFGELGAFYPATYHAATADGLLSRARHRLRLKQLAPLLTSDGALLDYGCGNGAFLLWAADRLGGRPLFGYEIGARRDVQKLAGGAVTIVRGTPDDLLDLLPPCRLITMNHVIEHLPDPLQTVSSLARILLPGGMIEGQTPAADSLERRVFKTRWSGYHAPRHTVVFSRAGLQRLLERAGLDDVAVRSGFNPAALAVSLAACTRGPGQGIRRGGLGWVWWLGCGTLLAPFDLLSGAPGIANFAAARRARS